jgi:dipeptidyl aminopeptidase/acylaminoacyl peptidase
MRCATRAGVLAFGIAVTIANGAAVMTDVTFTAAFDGSEQRYVQILPDGFDSTGRHDVLIGLHGLFADRWQFATDTRDECRAARDAAAERNMIYLSPDYRGPSCMNTPAESDVVQIIGLVKARYLVSRVFICGASMGGHSSLIFTILHPRLVDGVAAMNCKANMTDPTPYTAEIATAYGGTPEQVPQEYYKRSAEYFPDSFLVPLGMTLSGKDDIVPPASSLRLAQSLRDRGKRVLVVYEPDFGHYTNYADARTILDFAFDSAAVQPTPVRPVVAGAVHCMARSRERACDLSGRSLTELLGRVVISNRLKLIVPQP